MKSFNYVLFNTHNNTGGKTLSGSARGPSTLYNSDFYRVEESSSSRSASIVVREVLHFIKPTSVVDVGCGVGAFLREFKNNEVKEVLGIDGPWIKHEMLKIEENEFMTANLESPLNVTKKFDLVISLETAEHIEPEYSDQFIGNLVSLGDVILFSAAIPYQGGVHHVNEQWPDYWSEKFKKRGFLHVDCLRPRLWNNPDIDYFYSQNTIFYIRDDKLSKFGTLFEAVNFKLRAPLRLVHPLQYLPSQKLLNKIGRYIPTTISRPIRNYLIKQVRNSEK